MEIVVKTYEHFNRALPNWDSPKGKYIRTKAQYDRALKEAGMVTYEQSQRQNSGGRKEYQLSAKAKAIIEAASQSKDSKGNVKLSDRTINAMREMGAIQKKVPHYMSLPSHYTDGGFDT